MPNPNLSNDNITIKNASEEKILGNTNDNKLIFKSHLENVCKKLIKNLMRLLE